MYGHLLLCFAYSPILLEKDLKEKNIIMYRYFKKRFVIPAVAAGFLFVGASFKDDFFEIAKQIEIFTTLFKAVNTNYVDETNPVT